MATTRRRRTSAVWVLPLDSSGCGGCTQQIYALLGARYAAQMRAQGISLARSPHHADLVLITGALSEAAREPLQRVLAGVPQPRALVAVGDCAIDGCVFRDSPFLSSSAAETLDVNVEIAGCPPSPQAILDAITEAAQLLYREEEAEDEEEDIAEDEETEEAEESGELARPDEGEPDADAAANGPHTSQSAANGRGGA